MIAIKKWNEWLVESIGPSTVFSISGDFESVADSSSADWDSGSEIVINHNEKVLYVYSKLEFENDSPIMFRQGYNFAYQVGDNPIFSSMKDVLVRLIHEKGLAFRVYCGVEKDGEIKELKEIEHGGSGRGCVVIWNYYGDSFSDTEIIMVYKDDVDTSLSEDEIDSVLDARKNEDEDYYMGDTELTHLLNSIHRSESEAKELNVRATEKGNYKQDKKEIKKREEFDKKTDAEILQSGKIILSNEAESLKFQKVLLKMGYSYNYTGKNPMTLNDINAELANIDRERNLKYPLVMTFHAGDKRIVNNPKSNIDVYAVWTDTTSLIDPKYHSETNLTKALRNSINDDYGLCYYDQFMARFDK